MRGSIDEGLHMKINKSSVLLLLYFAYAYIGSWILVEIIDLHNYGEIQLTDNLILDSRMHIALPYTVGVFIFNVLLCIYFRKNKNNLKLLFMVLLNGNTFFPYLIMFPELAILYPISEIFNVNVVPLTNILISPFSFIETQVANGVIGLRCDPIIWIALGVLFVFSLILYISLLKSNKRQKALDDIQNKIDSTHITKDNSAS